MVMSRFSMVQDFVQFLAGRGVDIGGRFVKQQHVGRGGECPGNENPLALAAGEFGKRALPMIGEIDGCQGFFRGPDHFSGKGTESAFAGKSHENNIEDRYRKAAVKLHVLGNVAKAVG